MKLFMHLLSHPELLRNLEELNYLEPTEIQFRGIPHVRDGHDLFGLAQTGTGKTASFCLPLIEKLVATKSTHARVLILVPTRELCLQTEEVIHKFSKNLDVKACSIYGGVKQIYQSEEIKQGVDFIVATPGRLLDLIRKDLISLNHIESLVLDEADRMLDMGFTDDLNLILKALPQKHQTLMYSATLPEQMKNLVASILKNPIELVITPDVSVSEKINQTIIPCEANFKLQKLKEIIIEEAFGSVLVFVNSKTLADEVSLFLNRNGIDSKSIHSDKKQTEREKSIAQFASGKINLLVATDLVARGIDVESVALVINYELPIEAESYIHRIGRTGRNERSGREISLVAKEEMKRLDSIKKLVGEI